MLRLQAVSWVTLSTVLIALSLHISSVMRYGPKPHRPDQIVSWCSKKQVR